MAPPPATNNLGIITLQNGFQVTGRTVNGGGSPVPETDLDFVISSTGVEIPTAHDNAGPNGVFSVVVPADTYDIVFRPPFASGLAPLVQSSVGVGTSVNLGDVVLPNGFAITGQVTEDTGPVVVGVNISMVISSSGIPVPVFGSVTDLIGNYGFRQVSGMYDITFTPPAGSPLAPHTELGVNLTGPLTLDIVLTTGGGAPTFIRGDANSDSAVNVADVIAILESLFVGTGPLSCPDAGDANDDGGLDISDPIAILSYLFTAGAAPAPPFPVAGVDPTADALGCTIP